MLTKSDLKEFRRMRYIHLFCGIGAIPAEQMPRYDELSRQAEEFVGSLEGDERAAMGLYCLRAKTMAEVGRCIHYSPRQVGRIVKSAVDRLPD